jgi:hypothetical protein
MPDPATTEPFALIPVALLLHGLAHEGKDPSEVIVPVAHVAARLTDGLVSADPATTALLLTAAAVKVVPSPWKHGTAPDAQVCACAALTKSVNVKLAISTSRKPKRTAGVAFIRAPPSPEQP